MLIRLSETAGKNAGGKAGVLGVLLRRGLPVPDGFVVATDDVRIGPASERSLRDAVASELARLGDPVVAVRSSAANEDTADASAAGQYQSIIGVRGIDDVYSAILSCLASTDTDRVAAYWTRTNGTDSRPPQRMAALVQAVIEADASGVMFTPQRPGESTRIEASWGLGPSMVDGTVTPDTYEVTSDGAVRYTIGSKQIRTDLNREHGGVTSNTVAPALQHARALDDATVTTLAAFGGRITRLFGRPQDIEWAVVRGAVWILQARPITAHVPARRTASHARGGALTGTPGSHGTAAATARIVRSPSEFSTVHTGEIVVCPYTDPAWTPLFSIAAGVVTETGGALSHAAIVAREYSIPAVLAVTDATNRIGNGAPIVIDGTAGTVTVQ
ncbi:MAG TPA: hypothetical protein H9902_01875 [Candidatus Stackebrandtia faecavium]|nr:hypothetical protein [Candidatus Stackebrandtia faecavium]